VEQFRPGQSVWVRFIGSAVRGTVRHREDCLGSRMYWVDQEGAGLRRHHAWQLTPRDPNNAEERTPPGLIDPDCEGD
jgi:hypothetical protein